MTDSDTRSAGYQSYLKNKELHLSEARSTVRGSFMKSASSSNFATKIRTQEDPNDEANRDQKYTLEVIDSILPTYIISAAERKSEAVSENGLSSQKPVSLSIRKQIREKKASQESQIPSNPKQPRADTTSGKRESTRVTKQISFFGVSSPSQGRPPSKGFSKPKATSTANLQSKASAVNLSTKTQRDNAQTNRKSVDKLQAVRNLRKIEKSYSKDSGGKVKSEKTNELLNRRALVGMGKKQVGKMYTSSRESPTTKISQKGPVLSSVHDSLRHKRKENETSASLVKKSSEQSGRIPQKAEKKPPVWKPVSSHLRQPRSGQEKASENGDSVFKTKSSEQKTSNSRAFTSANSEEFYKRNAAWLFVKQEKLKQCREEKAAQETQECTFYPTVKEFYPHQETPSLDYDMQKEIDYKLVLDGKTFDLTNDQEVREFLMRSINKSGQRSIFRKSNDTCNRIYKDIHK